jgi:hypothetical protein
LKSYEKLLPKITYPQQDSIYRFDRPSLDLDQKESKQDLQKLIQQQDAYKIAWKGDELYTSLVTLKIFEGHNNDNEGLSDLLEQRTKELKQNKKTNKPTIPVIVLPPRQPDCVTLSYRHGPQHHPLTLFHTMKMKSEMEKVTAYRKFSQLFSFKKKNGLSKKYL